MAKVISFNNSTILMIETNGGTFVGFNSALDKELFIKTHKEGTYTLHSDHAIVKKYIVVDTEGTGWALTNKQGLTFEECATLIQHYL